MKTIDPIYGNAYLCKVILVESEEKDNNLYIEPNGKLIRGKNICFRKQLVLETFEKIQCFTGDTIIDGDREKQYLCTIGKRTKNGLYYIGYGYTEDLKRNKVICFQKDLPDEFINEFIKIYNSKTEIPLVNVYTDINNVFLDCEFRKTEKEELPIYTEKEVDYFINECIKFFYANKNKKFGIIKKSFDEWFNNNKKKQ